MEPPASTSACPACAVAVAADAKYCPQCAYPLTPQRRPAPAATPRWYYSVWWVLLMLFCVLGPLALPLLWKSPRFPRWAKIALTVLVGLFTYWLIAMSVTIARSLADRANQLQLFGF